MLVQIATAEAEVPYCPSAQPNMREARLLGIVRNGETSYLAEAVPLTGELLAMTQPVSPSRVLRIAARCEENACVHFDGVNCRLVTRIVQQLPAVTDTLPGCLIRADCRWYRQEGRAACLRCPQVVTEFTEENEAFRKAATAEVQV
ncbi:MAG TPA: nitrogen fixation protein [Candidatus Angelobacter sp.]|nr:nitrogen fixation protein [Candidatus Angelobacter sp.]